jgi:serine/threonine protein kinase
VPAGPPADGSRYRAVRLHAQGGLGEVHVAEDTELHRAVALKRIQPQHAGQGANLQRFLREAEITARLEHPGIVPVYGLVQGADGQPVYAMRFVEGDTFKQAIEHYPPFGGIRPQLSMTRFAGQRLSTVLLYHLDPPRNMRQFYGLDVQRELFGCWLFSSE